MTGNPGLEDSKVEQHLKPWMTGHTDEIINALLAYDAAVTPGFVDTTKAVHTENETYNFKNMKTGGTYHIECDPKKSVSIPKNTKLSSVVIVADCNIKVESGVEMTDVVLATLSEGNPGVDKDGGTDTGTDTGTDGDIKGKGKGSDKGKGGDNSGHGGSGTEHASIHFASGVTLGADDDCKPGGGVQIFSNASVQFTSDTEHNGVQVVAAGDIDFGTGGRFNGINAQAGQDITVNANNTFGDCTGGAPSLFTVDYYRLVY
jgi:hypothetical protein